MDRRKGDKAWEVLCFGDSNTWGYDPRSYLGERYPEEIRWTGLLAAQTGWRVREAGLNGRCIPRRPEEMAELAGLAAESGITVIMLGSNDLLTGPGLRAEDAAARMERCLEAVFPVCASDRVLLVAPPPMVKGTWVTEERLAAESSRLGSCYRDLAGRRGTAFSDAGMWGVEMLFDGVHFSPVGHRAFAAGIRRALESMPAGRG